MPYTHPTIIPEGSNGFDDGMWHGGPGHTEPKDLRSWPWMSRDENSFRPSGLEFFDVFCTFVTWIISL